LTEKISPEIQKQIMEFQEKQNTARMIVSQKYQLELSMKESEHALEELEKQENAEVHRAVGNILIKANASDVVSDLKEKVETINVRLKTIKSQEKKITDELKSLQDRLQGVLS